MKPSSAQPAPVASLPAPLESRVRFTLRGMLIATAAVAVCLAAVAPWLRQCTADKREAFLIIWGNVGAGMAIAVVAGCTLRRQAERRAGAARYRLPLAITKLAAIFSVGGPLIMLGIVALFSFVAVPAGAQAPVFNPMAIQCGAMVALAGLGLWWRTGCLELCDAGLVQACQFIAYESIRGFRWGSGSADLLLVQVGWMTVTVRVVAADKPQVEQFLQSRLHVA